MSQKPKSVGKEYTVLAVFNKIMSKKTKIIYENLAAKILERYLTEIAHDIGISPDAIMNKSSGKESFTMGEACAIAVILESSVEDLFQELFQELIPQI